MAFSWIFSVFGPSIYLPIWCWLSRVVTTLVLPLWLWLVIQWSMPGASLMRSYGHSTTPFGIKMASIFKHVFLNWMSRWIECWMVNPIVMTLKKIHQSCSKFHDGARLWKMPWPCGSNLRSDLRPGIARGQHPSTWMFFWWFCAIFPLLFESILGSLLERSRRLPVLGISPSQCSCECSILRT